MLQFAIQLLWRNYFVFYKKTLHIERVSQNGECLKKIFRVHDSDMYLFKIVSLEFLPLYEF